MIIDLRQWPWPLLAVLLSGMAWAWLYARGRQRRRAFGGARTGSAAAAGAALPVVCVAAAATYYYWRALRYGGPEIYTDTLRDLMNALVIARTNGRHLLSLPSAVVGGVIGPNWLYLLSVPLRTHVLGALPAALVVTEAATVIALFTLARRLAGSAVAGVACVLFVLSGTVAGAWGWLTHSNLLPLFSILTVLSLLQVEVDGRSERLIAVLFWLSMTLQMHITGVFLAAAVLMTALVLGRDAPLVDIPAALLAGLAPNLLVIPDLPWAGAQAPGQLLGSIVTQNTAALPVVVGMLVVARPATLRRRSGLLMGLVVLAVWAGWFCWNGGRPFDLSRLQFLNFALPSSGAQPPANSNQAVLPVLLQLLAFGSSAWFDYTLAAVFAALGIASCVAAVFDWPHPTNGGVARQRASLLLIWLLTTLPGGIAVCAGLGAFPRYFILGVIPWIVLVAIGVGAWWQAILALQTTEWRAARVLEVGIGVALLLAIGKLSPIEWAAAGPLVVRIVPLPRRGWALPLVASTLAALVVCQHAPEAEGGLAFRRIYLGEQLVAGLLRVPGLSARILDRRVHGAYQVLRTTDGGGLFFAQQALMNDAEELLAAPADPATTATHFLIAAVGAANCPASAVPLGDLGIVAVPYQPAIRLEEVHINELGQDINGSPLTNLDLPFYSVHSLELSYPAALQPRFRVAASPILRNHGGLAVDVEVSRDPPTQPIPGGIEVAIETVLPPWGAGERCHVMLFGDGHALPAIATGTPSLADSVERAQHWRFLPPAHERRMTLRLVVRDCGVSSLDLYDVVVAVPADSGAR